MVCSIHKHNASHLPADRKKKKKKKKKVSVSNAILRTDPTRTLGIRNAFVAETNLRFNNIKQLIRQVVITEDVFGLKPEGTENVTFAQQAKQRRDIFKALQFTTPGPRAFAFDTNSQKNVKFMNWLHEQDNKGILQLIPGEPRRATGNVPWSDVYIDSAYKQGQRRAHSELLKANGGVPVLPPFDDVFNTIDAAFSSPIHADRVAALHTRNYTELKGITDDMEKAISDTLAQGLIDGDGPAKIARKLVNRIEKGKGSLAIVDQQGVVKMRAKQRAIILARTETIRAHHVGMINTYKEAGLEGVTVLAEWATAGDNRVCLACESLQGKIFTLEAIEGLIPLHPQCRCVALPFLDSVKEGGFIEITEGVFQKAA